jgi:hypothetical protein
MKHHLRSIDKDKDLVNQKSYSDKLDTLSEQLISNEEDRQFVWLQRESRTGCIGPVDKKLAGESGASSRMQATLYATKTAGCSC